MGIDVRDSLLVGAFYDELEEFFERVIEEGETANHEACEDAGDVIECYFEYASPYYDSDTCHWFIGFCIPNYEEPNINWYKDVVNECARFEELTGVKPRIRGGAHVW